MSLKGLQHETEKEMPETLFVLLAVHSLCHEKVCSILDKTAQQIHNALHST